jgi:two-component system, OmpR family, response regulator QseB
MRVLLINCESNLLGSHLRKRGFTVDTETLKQTMASIGSQLGYDAILLGVPNHGGAEMVSRFCKEQMCTAVIVLSGRGASVAYWIELLNAGADDCVRWPSDLDEIAARIRAVMRRKEIKAEQYLAFSNLLFNLASRQLIVDNEYMIMRPREASLLEVLMEHAGSLVEKQELVLKIYGANAQIDSNALEFHMHNLRKRLNKARARACIRTVRGVGYSLQEVSEQKR